MWWLTQNIHIATDADSPYDCDMCKNVKLLMRKAFYYESVKSGARHCIINTYTFYNMLSLNPSFKHTPVVVIQW